MDRVAIIGIACLFPGADSPAAFWEMLAQGRRTAADLSADKLGAPPEVFYDPARRTPDTSYFLRGSMVEAFNFDRDGWRLPAATLERLGDSHRWALHTARGALADSGYLDRADLLARAGLVLGNLTLPTRQSNALFKPLYDTLLDAALRDALAAPDFFLPQRPDNQGTGSDTPHPANAHSPGYPAAVVSAALGLGGLNFALDAACASSLYAVALAADLLRAGHADLMLAGAVSAADPLFVTIGFAHLGGFPERGQDSLPLDRRSGGLIAGEGAGMFVLKRHADALRDGDRIYAVIGGAGLANDGAGKHILTPNSKGQVLALERAYSSGAVDPHSVSYVECHASGTPLGDRTELSSLEQFFSSEPRPHIGSVKANLGHLMTAAGMASMIKLILALAHDTLPPTPGAAQNGQPLESPGRTFGGAQIVRAPQPWPRQGQPRRAGVNAFGFGGVSAHLILEEDNRTTVDPIINIHDMPDRRGGRTRMAITGMDAHFGPLEGLDALGRAIYDAEPALHPLPEYRWKGLQHQPEILRQFGLPDGTAPEGAYIEAFDLDFMQVKIPPNPADEPIPQHLLLLKVADRAIRDAGLQPGGRVAVLVALGTELTLHQYRGRADLNWQVTRALENAGIDLDAEQRVALARIAKDSLLSPAQVNHYTSYIGNIVASRVSSLWDFNGPSFTISAEENSAFKALAVAEILLANGDVDAVVVGAVDLAGSMESVLVRAARAPLHAGKPRAGFDANATGWQVGEGAGALVLTRAADAGPTAYASIDAVAIAQEMAVQGELPGAPGAETVARAAREALLLADANPADIGYIEFHASGIPDEDAAEITGLTQAYQGGPALHTAVGSVKSVIGHTYAASGMAGVIQAALAVGHRFIPAVPNWDAPELADAWTGAPFWVANKARTWFDSTRRAAVSGLGADGAAAHVVLSSVTGSSRRADYLRSGSGRGGAPALVLASGASVDALLYALAGIADRLEAGTDELGALADAAYHAYDPNAAYALALVARSRDELRQEIDRARRGVPQAAASGRDWSTPLGSTFAPNPVGRAGHVAFVYPGAFNSYPKLGYDLFHLFPSTLDALAETKSNVPEAVAEARLYPRSVEKPSTKLTRQMKDALTGDNIAMIESGLSFALAFSRVVRDVFGIRPGAAFGYSLGEGSMMWGMDVWRDGDAGSAAFHSSHLFEDRLVGPMKAVRAAWGIPPTVPTEQFWAAHFVAAPVERVRAAVEQEPRVYLTHINTPNEVMIAGDPTGCQRVLDAVGSESMKAPFTVAIHNDAMMGEYGEFYRLHDLPVHDVPGVQFYSAADYAPVRVARSVIAASIARMACKPVDFARLIRQVYAGGARVFIELGPRSTCARWIDETLGNQPHLAVSIDQMGVDARTSVLRMLAQLIAHRTPLNLDALYNPPTAQPERSLVRRVRLGGEDVYASIVTAIGASTPAAQPAPVAAMPAAAPAMTPPPAQPVNPAGALPEGINNVHADFLRARRDALEQMGDLIRQQIAAAAQGGPVAQPAPVEAAAPALPVPPQPQPAPPPSVARGHQPFYTYDDINTFALGRIADVFGEPYAVYDDRRAPRIPNGDLLLISRIVDIEGERHRPQQKSRIIAEYDVPVDIWFYRDNPYPTMPYSVLMEIALQPCGILSAWHGPTLKVPDADLYFRNLDGRGTLHVEPDLRGRTITNHVEMISSTELGTTIIQTFTYHLYDGDTLFYEGEATFGYFTQESLASRAGLDAGKPSPRWLEAQQPRDLIDIDPARPYGQGYTRLAGGQLLLTDLIRVQMEGGKHGAGYAYGMEKVDPDAWYFRNHFFQDPVMPGSIGVETMLQALQGWAIRAGLGADLRAPHFAQVDGGHTVIWKYRGQVLGTFDAVYVEVHVKAVRRYADHVEIVADASLWRDNLRIYEVTGLALALKAAP
ncbi:MAG: beta-ketoacyl synthase N-terminal-like domain-containing protein [Phototrophicaceae bacterium]